MLSVPGSVVPVGNFDKTLLFHAYFRTYTQIPNYEAHCLENVTNMRCKQNHFVYRGSTTVCTFHRARIIRLCFLTKLNSFRGDDRMIPKSLRVFKSHYGRQGKAHCHWWAQSAAHFH